MTFEMKFSQDGVKNMISRARCAILAACLPRSTKRSTRHLGIGHARLTVGSTKQHVANGRHGGSVSVPYEDIPQEPPCESNTREAVERSTQGS